MTRWPPIDEFFATTYTYHNPSLPHVKDLSTLKDFNTATYGAFPDIHFTLEDMVAEGDRWFTEPLPEELIRESSWGSQQPVST